MKSSRHSRNDTAAYCHLGWGDNELGVPNYPEACVGLAFSCMGDRPRRKALDAGQTIVRSSFELAREFDEVIGIDLSASLVREAQRLKESGVLRYTIPVEGEIEASYEIFLKKFGLEHASKKVNFWQADITALKPLFSDFDLILALNVIDTISDPEAFLRLAAERVCKRGLLILGSSYGWCESITPREKWIGGYMRDKEKVLTLHGLKEILSENFELIATKDIPCVFQKSVRRYDYDIVQITVWERK